MIEFKNDEQLGKVVSKTEYFSWFEQPIKNVDEIKKACGAHKFSALCGFKFYSIVDVKSPVFELLFVPKIGYENNRSKNRTTDRNVSKWFIVRPYTTGWQIFGIDKTIEKYNFNVNKFFQSDLFRNTLPYFEENAKKGFAQIDRIIKMLEDYTATPKGRAMHDRIDSAIKDCRQCRISLNTSIPLIKIGKVQDKNYKMPDYDQSHTLGMITHATDNA